MNLQHLRVFMKVAELEHMTRAAEQLGVSQPLVSRTVQLLEQETNQTLFHRQGRRVTLTHEGKIVKHFARQIFQIENKLEQVLKEHTADAIHL